MKKMVIVTEKAALANLLKSKVLKLESKIHIQVYKTLSNSISEYDIVFMDEKIARKGYKKEYRNVSQLSRQENVRVVVLGQEDVWMRLKTRIDGAFDYLSYESFTSDVLDEYLKKVILK